MQNLFFSALIFLFSFYTQAETTVYFFEYRMPNGQVYTFDEGGRFYHVAMKYKNQVLEAHPYFGVRLVVDIKKVGHLVAVLKHHQAVKNLDLKVQAELGKKFDLYSPWNDPTTTQCSKLIGQIIGVSPVIVANGNLSLSPDLLYAELIKHGFRDCQSCLPK